MAERVASLVDEAEVTGFEIQIAAEDRMTVEIRNMLTVRRLELQRAKSRR